ncbi:MAG: hypothetical protein R3350_05665, partial [Saprospiraceae bacterium]|nr:hypothetical protein [Saprospiraceae bacterium]
MKKIGFLLSLLAIGNIFLRAQGNHLPLDDRSYHILDRLEIKTGLPTPYLSSVKYYTRGEAVRFALKIDTTQGLSLSGQDRLDLYYLFKNNNEWLFLEGYPTPLTGPRPDGLPDSLSRIEASVRSNRYIESRKPLLGIFYRTPANFLEVNEAAFHLRLNPIINFKYGLAGEGDPDYYYNRRGVEMRGGFDDRIYFYTSILETQAQFPDYVRRRVDRTGALPGEGLIKSFNDDFFGIDSGYDFLNGQGYLGFNISAHLGLQFGYGRNFLGNGYRSVLLSDFANNYLYLKLNWQVWKLHYQNIFAELSVESSRSRRGDELIGKKYMAAHYLGLDILPNLSIGIYEAVIFSRNNQFELQYLVPFMLYRTIEQAVGSPDNVLLG